MLKKIRENDLLESLTYRLVQADFDYEKKNEPGVKRKSRYRKYNKKEKAVFDTVFRIRENFAKKLNKPPNSVIANEQIFQIAEHRLDVKNINFSKIVPILDRSKIIQEIFDEISKLSTDK